MNTTTLTSTQINEGLFERALNASFTHEVVRKDWICFCEQDLPPLFEGHDILEFKVFANDCWRNFCEYRP